MMLTARVRLAASIRGSQAANTPNVGTFGSDFFDSESFSALAMICAPCSPAPPPAPQPTSRNVTNSPACQPASDDWRLTLQIANCLCPLPDAASHGQPSLAMAIHCRLLPAMANCCRLWPAMAGFGRRQIDATRWPASTWAARRAKNATYTALGHRRRPLPSGPSPIFTCQTCPAKLQRSRTSRRRAQRARPSYLPASSASARTGAVG